MKTTNQSLAAIHLHLSEVQKNHQEQVVSNHGNFKLIEIKNLKRSYKMGDQILNALDGVDVRIEQGEFVAIMGPSGSGKSTLMHILGLLDVADVGNYELCGVDVSKMNDDDLSQFRSEKIGFVFQQFHLLSRYSALENVCLPQLYMQGKVDENYSKEILTNLGIGDKYRNRPNQLSGGQQQRVAIARALANKPAIILADEPTGNLDSKSEQEVLAILADLHRQGITVIIVTHEPELAKYVERVIRLKDGKIVSDEKNANFPTMLNKKHPEVALVKSKTFKENLQNIYFEFRSYFDQAIRSLATNKLRSFLSMLGIFIGVSSVITMLALGRGATESIKAQLSSLGSNILIIRPTTIKSGGIDLGAGSAVKLSVEDAQDLKTEISEIKDVSPTVSAKGQAVFENKNWSTQVQGVWPQYEQMKANTPSLGRFFTTEENISRSRVALVGRTVLKSLFADLPSGTTAIGQEIKINKVSFQVIGILPEKGSNGYSDQDDVIMIPLMTAMKRLMGKDYVDGIEIQVADDKLMPSVIDRITDSLKNKHRIPQEKEAFQIRNLAEIQQALSSTSKIMSLLLSVIASISLLVGGIGIMNIMLVSVAERTKEIGLRKAIGAKPKNIQRQFLTESVAISLLGGFIGIIFGIAISFVISAFAGWNMIVSLDSVILAAGFASIIGVVFGFFPARSAAKLNPIQALRHE